MQLKPDGSYQWDGCYKHQQSSSIEYVAGSRSAKKKQSKNKITGGAVAEMPSAHVIIGGAVAETPSAHVQPAPKAPPQVAPQPAPSSGLSIPISKAMSVGGVYQSNQPWTEAEMQSEREQFEIMENKFSECNAELMQKHNQ